MSNLIYYYNTVYPTKCTPDLRYLSTKEGVAAWSRIITLGFLPIQILTSYCILKKTPDTMSSVKYSILNVNIGSYISGIALSFIVTPFNFFPYMAGFTIGLASDFGFSIITQFYIGIAVTFIILISILILFENRSSLITRNLFAIKKPVIRIIWIASNYFGALMIIFPVFYYLPDQTKAKMEVLKELPCPAKEFFTEPFLFIASDPFWKNYFIITLMSIYVWLMFQILFLSACCIYHLFFYQSFSVSPQTRKHQIQSFYSIIGQTLIPILFDTIPIIVMLDRKKRDEYDQYNNNLMVLSIMFHNGATNLSIMLVHKPYRNFLKSIICGKKKKEINIIHVSTDELRRI